MRGMNAEGALLPSGGYRALRSTRVAEVLYDAAAAFCGRFIPKGSRTHDQRVQAARSGIGWRQGVRGRPRPLVGTPRRGVRGGFGETALPPCPPPIRRIFSASAAVSAKPPYHPVHRVHSVHPQSDGCPPLRAGTPALPAAARETHVARLTRCSAPRTRSPTCSAPPAQSPGARVSGKRRLHRAAARRAGRGAEVRQV
jgi:hypothetical protein